MTTGDVEALIHAILLLDHQVEPIKIHDVLDHEHHELGGEA